MRLKHRGVCVMQKLFTELYITSEDAICSNGSADTSDNSKGAYDMQEVVCWELCESNDLINDRERLAKSRIGPMNFLLMMTMLNGLRQE